MIFGEILNPVSFLWSLRYSCFCFPVDGLHIKFFEILISAKSGDFFNFFRVFLIYLKHAFAGFKGSVKTCFSVVIWKKHFVETPFITYIFFVLINVFTTAQIHYFLFVIRDTLCEIQYFYLILLWKSHTVCYKKRFTSNHPNLYNYFLNYVQLRRKYNEDKVYRVSLVKAAMK